MRIYFEDLKQDIQQEIMIELMVRLAGDLGAAADDYLAGQAQHLINTRNSGVDMEF